MSQDAGRLWTMIFVICAGLLLPGGARSVDVWTQHNDSQRTGGNLQEPALRPEVVSSGSFGQLGAYEVQGQIFAQPLYISGVAVPRAGTRNMLLVATAANLVYGFDADDYTSYWTFDAGSFQTARAAGLYPGRDPDIAPEVGILGTPVVDVAHQTIYFVAMTQPDQHEAEYFHTLHAVDIRTGIQRGAIRITGAIEGGGTFNSGRQSQRAALALIGDQVYVSWASFGDIAPYDGLVMSYGTVDSSGGMRKTGQFQVARFNPILGDRHKSGGIWHSGGGPAADETGEFFYVVTGNGDSSNTHAGEDFDSSDVKLDSSLRVIDYYTPSFQNFLNDHDLDLSVSGPVVVRQWTARDGKVIRRLVHGSKQGILYNVNRDNMGHFHEHENPVQQVSVFDEPDPGSMMEKRHIHSTPVLWERGVDDRRVYVASDWGLGIKAFRFNDDGNLDPAPVAQARRNPYAFTQMSLSADGANGGVLWSIGCVDCVTDNPPDTRSKGKAGVLVAFDALRLGDPLFVSAPLGTYARFNAPTIANGRVYVPTFGEVDSQTRVAAKVVVFGAARPADATASAARRNFLQGNRGTQGNFELLSPSRALVREYFRDNDDRALAWHHLRDFGYPVRANQLGRSPRSVTFIQSNFKGDGVHGNFEAVVRVAPPLATQPDTLDFWFLDSKTSRWHGPFPLVGDGQPVTNVTGDPVLIQGNWGQQGNFELLVPQGNLIGQYFRDNDDPRMPWHHLRDFGYPARPNELGPWPRSVTFIQSNFKGDGVHGNFEAIVRVAPPLATEPDTLDFWFMDSSTARWEGPFPLMADAEPVTNVTGDPVLIQSNWGAQGNFELLVPRDHVVREYFRNNDSPGFPWHWLRDFGYPVRRGELGGSPRSVAFIQSNFKGDGTHGNFEAIVRVAPPLATQPDALDFWFLDSRTSRWNGPFPLVADGRPVSDVTGN